MKTLYFDRQTLKGKLSMSIHADIAIDVNDDIKITKVITEYDKDIQKVNENNEPLYLQNVYETVIKEDIIGYEKTTEITDNPCIESVWKTNEDGFKLYSQRVYNEDMEFTGECIEVLNHMNIFDYKEESWFEPTDKIIGEDEEGNPIYEHIEHKYEVPNNYEYNEPIYVDVHVEDEEGNKLYLKPIKEVLGEERVITETIETTVPIHVFSYREEEVTKTVMEMISNCNHVCNEFCGEDCAHTCDKFCEPVFETKEVTETVQIPDEFEENNPVMIPSYKEVEVDIFSRPDVFTINEVLEAIYAEKMQKYNYTNIIMDMFINEEDIDFTYEEHLANTGAFILTLLPQGNVRLNTVELEVPARKFELLDSEIPKDIDIYINDVKFVDDVAILSQPVTSCVIRFENKSSKSLDVKSYAIMY